MPATEFAEARESIQEIMGRVATDVGEMRAKVDAMATRVQDHHVNHPRKFLINESRIESLNEEVRLLFSSENQGNTLVRKSHYLS